MSIGYRDMQVPSDLKRSCFGGKMGGVGCRACRRGGNGTSEFRQLSGGLPVKLYKACVHF